MMRPLPPPSPRRLDNRTLRTIALLVIVGTLPFYLIGGGLWLAAPRATPTPNPGLQPTITGEAGTTVTAIATIAGTTTVVFTPTSLQPTFSLFTPGTLIPTVTLPPTRFMTLTPSPTSAATNTFTPPPATDIPPPTAIIPTVPPLIPATDTPSF